LNIGKLSPRTKKYFVIIFLLSVCYRFTFMPYLVNGESMEPNLSHGQIGLALRTSVEHQPQRFDIVVIKLDRKYIIKRVIGLPGERIDCQGNQILINGSKLEDDYASGWTSDFSYQLSNSEYFCLGDNRENSSDSRVYGAFNAQDIKAISISKGE